VTENELQAALLALGRRLDSGEVDAGLVTRVIERLPAVVPPPVSRRGRWVRPVLITAALLLLGAATAVAGSDTVRSWLHASGIDAKPVTTLLTTVSTRTIADLGAGSPVGAASAGSVLGHPIPRSSTLGRPAAILASTTGEPLVTLVWKPAPDLPAGATAPAVGALLTIAPRRDPNAGVFLGKALGGKTHVEFVVIPGFGNAVWIAGAPHAVTLFDGRTMIFRLAANVLVWSNGGDVLRFESALDREAAIAAAASFAG
jgi:hypothetical protein